MKNYIASLLAALCAFAFSACVSETPQQQVATGIYASGYAASSDALNHDATLIATIQDIAAKLPLINSGKLTSTDMGVLAGELQKVGSVIPGAEIHLPGRLLEARPGERIFGWCHPVERGAQWRESPDRRSGCGDNGFVRFFEWVG